MDTLLKGNEKMLSLTQLSIKWISIRQPNVYTVKLYQKCPFTEVVSGPYIKKEE